MRYATEPCPEPQAFYFANGARARSLQEFRAEVQRAPGDVLNHHRGHFHFWVRDILQDPALAERVRAEGDRARDGEALRKALLELAGQALQQAGAPAGTGREPGRGAQAPAFGRRR